MTHEWTKDGIVASDDPARIDMETVYGFLRTAYWSTGIPRETVEKSIRHSLAMGLYDGERMIGFARVITDYATFAYVGDVFVLDAWRGRGLATWLTECLVGHPELQGMRRWILATRDAHNVYARVGFKPLANPQTMMTIHDPDIYKR
jgi:predicted GNAT family acetyltransferase